MELLLIIVFVVGFFLGKLYGYYHVVKLMKEIAADNGLDLEKALGLKTEEKTTTPEVYKLKVEQHGDMLYLFDYEQDEFICQGSSVQELAKRAKEYKNICIAAVLHGEKVFKFKDGESTEVLA